MFILKIHEDEAILMVCICFRWVGEKPPTYIVMGELTVNQPLKMLKVGLLHGKVRSTLIASHSGYGDNFTHPNTIVRGGLVVGTPIPDAQCTLR